jgi:hypothetical protein
MFLFPKKRKNSTPFRKSKELDVNSLRKQLGRLTYISLGLEILKVAQAKQFSMTLQKKKKKKHK